MGTRLQAGSLWATAPVPSSSLSLASCFLVPNHSAAATRRDPEAAEEADTGRDTRGWVGRWMDPTFISLVVRALRNACRRAWRRGRVRGAPCPRVSVDDYVPPRACGILWRMWMFFPRSGLCARIDMCFEIKLVKIALDSHM